MEVMKYVLYFSTGFTLNQGDQFFTLALIIHWVLLVPGIVGIIPKRGSFNFLSWIYSEDWKCKLLAVQEHC